MSADGRCPICNGAEDTAGRCYNPTCLGQAPVTTFTPGPPVHIPYVHTCCEHVRKLEAERDHYQRMWTAVWNWAQDQVLARPEGNGRIPWKELCNKLDAIKATEKDYR